MSHVGETRSCLRAARPGHARSELELRMVVGRFAQLVQNRAWLVVFLSSNVLTAVLTVVYLRTDDRERELE